MGEREGFRTYVLLGGKEARLLLQAPPLPRTSGRLRMWASFAVFLDSRLDLGAWAFGAGMSRLVRTLVVLLLEHLLHLWRV